jgi:U4/U6 small nuclear ribonucleoprotein PRP4
MYRLRGFELFGSQIASDRPVSTVRFSPSGDRIAVGTWSGTVKILDVPNLEDKILLRGHTDVVSGISWMPGATLPDSNVSPSTVNLATGGGEGTINLWSLEKDTPLSTLSGHEGRVSRVDIHPSSRYLASASHDMTWRLWDIETSTELLLQEGHSREVHTVSFNTDGSLIASAGLDSVGRIWDVRTGRMVMFLDSHIQPIYALDWGVDGYRVLSGSADGFIKCWDVRAVKESATIGAHIGGVTDLKWFKGTDGPTHLSEPTKDEKGEYIPKKSGTFFVSTGFDREVKIFSADDWALTKTLKAHSGNVTGVDVTDDSKWIASCGRDRTVKLWARDDMEAI